MMFSIGKHLELRAFHIVSPKATTLSKDKVPKKHLSSLTCLNVSGERAESKKALKNKCRLNGLNERE